MTCYLCNQQIEPEATINWHHYETLRSAGGTLVAPTHQQCHVEHHSSNGDFRHWGKLSAETRAWAFNLKNVRTHPAYEFDRQYYLMMYAH